MNIFKFAEENKKTVELLFENLKEKKDKFKEISKKIINSEDKFKQSNYNFTYNRLLISQNSNCLKVHSNKDKPNIHKINEEEDDNNVINHNISNIISHTPQIIKQNLLNKNCYYNHIRKKEFIFNASQIKRYEKVRIFPYRYYFFTSFIKNIDIKKLSSCFSKKFTKVYLFFSKMFDISSYLILQREFQILKSTIFKGENINIIENAHKINVNEKSFIRNMNECIDKGQFKIFSQNIDIKKKNK